MRVIFDYQVFLLQRYGGISRYIYNISRYVPLVSKVRTLIVAPFYINEYLREGGVSVYGLYAYRFRKFLRVFGVLNSFFSWLFFRLYSPEIIHLSYFSNLLAMPENSKVILTVYDMIHEKFPESFASVDKIVSEKAAAVSRADHIICISRNTQDDLIKYCGVDRAKTSVVYLGFALGNRTIQINPVSRQKPYLFYVGKRNGYKNFNNLLKAVACSDVLKKSHRVICFGGGGFNNDELGLINKLGFSENDVLYFSGDDDELAGFYSNASAFVYPSLYEGFGIPPLEAMSFDCPVICSNVSSIPEVVGNAGCYFDPDNIQDIREKIESVLSDRLLRDQLVMAGRQRIKQFTWERCALETVDVYKKVLECEH